MGGGVMSSIGLCELLEKRFLLEVETAEVCIVY